MLQGADEDAAEQVDEHDQQARDRIAAHELARAVHRAVEVGFGAHLGAPRGGFLLRDDAGVEVGVDRHLLAGQGIEGEAGAHLGNAPGALGDDHEVDDDQDREHHHADGVVATDDEFAEGLDHLAGGVRARVALE